MNEKSIRIGTVGVPTRKESLYGKVDVVEISDTFNSVPKSQVGRKRRADTPARVTYTVQLPKQLFIAPSAGSPLPGDPSCYGGFQNTEENRSLFARTARYADALEADALVLLTPADFTPTKPKQEALIALLENIDRGDKTVVWQPSGPWETDRAARFARQINAVLAVDPLHDPPPEGDVCYLRLGPFSAMGSRVGVYDLERIARTAAAFDTATVVFETARALDDAVNLKGVLADGFDNEDDDFDDLESDFDEE